MHVSPFGRGETFSQLREDCRWEPSRSINTPIVWKKHFLIRVKKKEKKNKEEGESEAKEKKEAVEMPWGCALSLPRDAI